MSTFIPAERGWMDRALSSLGVICPGMLLAVADLIKERCPPGELQRWLGLGRCGRREAPDPLGSSVTTMYHSRPVTS